MNEVVLVVLVASFTLMSVSCLFFLSQFLYYKRRYEISERCVSSLNERVRYLERLLGGSR